MGRIRLAVLGFVTCSALGLTSPLAAQDDAARTAAARALFEQGMRAVDAGDWDTARDRLQRSIELRPSPVVRYNLALALSELGRLVEASEHLRAVQRESREGSDAHRLASERLAALLPRIGRLRIDVSGARDTVEVRLDGEIVLSALVGVPQPADPGARRVSLHRDGVELAAREVTVVSGELATVTLDAPSPEAVSSGAVSPEEAARAGVTNAPASEPSAATGGVETEWWFWTIIGVVVAGAAIGLAVGLSTPQYHPYIVGDSGQVHPTLVELP